MSGHAPGSASRRLAAMGTFAAVLVAVPTVGWGWPGLWALTALPAAFLLGAAVSHGIDAWMGRVELRLGVVVLGATAGTVAALGALLFMVAVNLPDQRDVRASLRIDQAPAGVWGAVGQPALWGRWDAFIGALEPERGAPPGTAFRTTLLLGGEQIPARHVVDTVDAPTRFAWRVELTEGTALDDLRIALSLADRDGATDATYALSYRLPTTTARALDLLILRQTFAAIAAQSLERLDVFARERDRVE